MVAIARQPTEWPEYAKADFTLKAVEPRQYEATWSPRSMPTFLRGAVGKVTCGWLLVTLDYRPLCDGRWAVNAVWEKSSDPHRLCDSTQSLSFDDCEYYHPGSTHSIRFYQRTKLIPTIRILWLWLRLAMKRRKKDGRMARDKT